MGKLAIKLWNYVLKGRKFVQSYISDRLSVSADISDPLSVIRIPAKFNIGASLIIMWGQSSSDTCKYWAHIRLRMQLRSWCQYGGMRGCKCLLWVLSTLSSASSMTCGKLVWYVQFLCSTRILVVPIRLENNMLCTSSIICTPNYTICQPSSPLFTE